MNGTETTMLDRREFLRGAAVMTIAAGLGFGSPPRAAAGPPQAHTTLALWSRDRWIDPASLPSGSEALASAVVAVTFHGHSIPEGAAPVLHAVKAYYAIQSARGPQDIPMYAWAPSAQRTTIRIPAAPGRGVMLSAELFAPRGAEDFHFLLSGHASGRPKLTEGTYILAAGEPNLAGVRLTGTPSRPAIADEATPIPFEYLLVTVA
ncbi:MAG: twin-arginine translocation signal domain-containing protein [Capsulimonas sp.]|uniref:twin-arginine translocation signal domain-containing protein n=1 Tax=Capsulimonas sp. TaxID=2494211 RepID=UPI0032630D9F